MALPNLLVSRWKGGGNFAAFLGSGAGFPRSCLRRAPAGVRGPRRGAAARAVCHAWVLRLGLRGSDPTALLLLLCRDLKKPALSHTKMELA